MKFTQEFANEFTERVASGRTIEEICKADDMPAVPTVSKWLKNKPDFHRQVELIRRLIA